MKLNQRVKLRFIATQGMHGIVIPDIGVNNVVNIGPAPTEVEVTPKKLGTFVARWSNSPSFNRARIRS